MIRENCVGKKHSGVSHGWQVLHKLLFLLSWLPSLNAEWSSTHWQEVEINVYFFTWKKLHIQKEIVSTACCTIMSYKEWKTKTSVQWEMLVHFRSAVKYNIAIRWWKLHPVCGLLCVLRGIWPHSFIYWLSYYCHLMFIECSLCARWIFLERFIFIIPHALHLPSIKAQVYSSFPFWHLSRS